MHPNIVFVSIAFVTHCHREFFMKHALIVIAALALPLSLTACSKPAEETTEATVAPMAEATPAVEAEVATTEAVNAAEAAIAVVDVPAAEATDPAAVTTEEAAPAAAPY